MALTDLFSAPGSQSLAFNPGLSNISVTNNPVVNGRAYLDTLANKFILKPVNAKGIGGYVFDYEGETTIHIQSEITDHYAEDNTFTNDMVAQKPVRITLRGYSAELSQAITTGVLGVLSTLQSKLTTLPAILGKYTPAIVPKIAALTTKATNVVNTVDNYISRAQNLAGLFIGSAVAQTKQQLAYKQLYGLWFTNQMFTLTTPFNYFPIVLIESITFTQDETTKQWSEISVTVKEVRFFKEEQAGINGLSQNDAEGTCSERSAFQIQSPINNGKVQGVEDNNVDGACQGF